MSKLILDLRGNGGGYMYSALHICNQFLYSGELIVYTKGRNKIEDEYYSDYNGGLKDTELVILIDEGSASASEIVAGCMQDNDRAIIVGKRSFGKGLVQEEIKMSDGSAIRITTQRYYIPSGRCIQKSYSESLNEYDTETDTRELNEKIYYHDSLKYKTKLGRDVYGGGGIIPDSIVWTDTTLNFSVINYIYAQDWINEFALIYKNQDDKIENYFEMDQSKIYFDFKQFILKKENDFDFSMGDKEEKQLQSYLKSVILKNRLGNDAYFESLAKDDEFIIKGLDILSAEYGL